MADEKNGTILVIEDEEMLNSLLVEELEGAGYEVFASLTGEKGMQIMSREKDNIDCLLLDLMLPKMDGFEVMDRMKQNADLQSIPIVVLSNLGDKSNIQKAKEKGAIDYFIKSDMTPDKVVPIVENNLDNKKT